MTCENKRATAQYSQTDGIPVLPDANCEFFSLTGMQQAAGKIGL